jgi:hypothetical protein
LELFVLTISGCPKVQVVGAGIVEKEGLFWEMDIPVRDTL